MHLCLTVECITSGLHLFVFLITSPPPSPPPWPSTINPNGLGSFLEKHVFDPFLVAKKSIFKAFCEFGGAKMACNWLKRGSFHLFRHPKWSRITFGKTHF